MTNVELIWKTYFLWKKLLMDDRISNCGLDGKVIIKRRNENWRSLLVTFESLRSQFYLILNNHLMAKKIHWKYILLSKQQAEKNIFDLTSDLYWLSNADLRGKNFNSSFWVSLVSIFRNKKWKIYLLELDCFPRPRLPWPRLEIRKLKFYQMCNFLWL